MHVRYTTPLLIELAYPPENKPKIIFGRPSHRHAELILSWSKPLNVAFCTTLYFHFLSLCSVYALMNIFL